MIRKSRALSFQVGSTEATKRNTNVFIHPTKSLSTDNSPITCYNSFYEEIGRIRRRIGIKYENILYDSDVDGFDKSDLYSKILYKYGVMFICITPTKIFGIYKEGMIEPQKSDSSDDNKKSFTFYSSKAEKGIVLQDGKDSFVGNVRVSSSLEDDNIILLDRTFELKNDGTIHFHKGMESISNSSAFLGKEQCNKFIALEWIWKNHNAFKL